VLLVTTGLVRAAVKHSHTENFTTTAYKDTLFTTAVWDTVLGRLELAPFQMTSVGSYDTPVNPPDVRVTGDMAFVADGTGGLLIFDISNPASPVEVGTYDTPGTVQALWIHGDLVFVCDYYDGLHIVDVSTPSAPSLVSTYNTSGRVMDAEVAGDYAFVADYDAGLVVFDISNPALPSLVGSYNTPGFARDVDVEGNYAYVADRSGGGLQVVDISNPVAPTSAGAYSTGGDTWGVAVSGNVAYLGVSSLGFVAVDVTDPTNPVWLSTTAAGSARRLEIVGDLVYVAGHGALYAFDVTDPSNPAMVDSYVTPGVASAVDVDGEHAYVADGTVGGLQVIHCAFPAGPVSVGSYDTPYQTHELCVAGDYAYLADGHGGLQVIDVSDPLTPSLAGSYDTGGFGNDVCVSGDHAYLAQGLDGLAVIDVTDPGSPSLVGTYADAYYYYGVDVSGDLLCVADGIFGMRVIDVLDPTAPAQLGTYNTPGTARDVSFEGDVVFVADGSWGLQIFDVSNPSAPGLIGSYLTLGSAYCVSVAGDHAFVADFTSGLAIIDISDPTAPTLAGAYDTQGRSYGIDVVGNYAFLADDTYGFHTFDISDPTAPTLIETYDTPGNARGVCVRGDHAFVADFAAGLQVIQVFQREFETDENAGRSLTLLESIESVARVRLTSSQTDNVSWHVGKSAPNVSIEPDGAWSDITGNPGPDLVWRTNHEWAAPGVNPSVTQVQIDWLYSFAVIDSVVDIPNDQGRQVSIHWTRSGSDFVGSASQIVEYAVYRRIDPLLSPPVEGRAMGEPQSPMAWPPGDWHYVMTVPAHAEDVYATVVPTLADSTIDEGMYQSTFFVRAMTATPGAHFDSYPDSGFSVDNLDPTVPQGFSVAYNSGGGTDLLWEECPDEDFQYFRVYRSESADFTPGPGNLAYMTTGTAWRDDVADGYNYHYKVSAVDFSGNESDASGPSSATGVAVDTPPKGFTLHQNVPNPFNPMTVISYDVPANGGHVTVRIYDVNGRAVITLVDGIEEPGRNSVTWDGRDASGADASAGVYFYRLEAPGYEKTLKMVLIK